MSYSHHKVRRKATCAARWLPLSVALLTLSACASLPDSRTIGSPKSSDDYAAASLGQGQAQWPAENWWTAYQDAELQALITEALNSAPDMRVAEARARQAYASAQFTKGDLLPTLGASASAQMQRQSYNMGFPAPRGWNDVGRASLDFSWEIDFWGKNRAAYAAALSSAKAADAERAQAALALSTAIASDYARLAGLFAEQDAAKDAVTVRGRTLALMTERQQNGLENQGAVERARAAEAQAQAQLAASSEAIALLRYRIAALLGAGPDRAEQIARPNIKAIQIRSGQAILPPELPANLLGRRPDIVAARLRLEAADKHIDVAQRNFYPNVNLAGFLGLSSLKLADFAQSGSLIGGAGPALYLPIFQGGKLRAQYRLTEAQYEEAVGQYDAAVARAFAEVSSAVTSLSALDERLRHARTAHEAAKAAWNIANNRYRGGLASALDVLVAEDAMIAARRDLAAMETRAFALDIDLIRALGGGYTAS